LAGRRVARTGRGLQRGRTFPAQPAIPAAVKIRRAAKASRSMTVQERLQVMLKAGLLTREQAETETAEKPE
jgi:hypothetical protein